MHEFELAPGITLIIDGNYAAIRKYGELGERHQLPLNEPYNIARVEATNGGRGAIIYSDRVNPIVVSISGATITVGGHYDTEI